MPWIRLDGRALPVEWDRCRRCRLSSIVDRYHRQAMAKIKTSNTNNNQFEHQQSTSIVETKN
jgi:hypothetical protein